MHHQNARRECENLVQVARGHHDRGACRCCALKSRVDRSACADVEPAGRIFDDQEFGVLIQLTSEDELLLVPPGEISSGGFRVATADVKLLNERVRMLGYLTNGQSAMP